MSRKGGLMVGGGGVESVHSFCEIEPTYVDWLF